MGQKPAKLHGGGKSRPVLGFRMAFLFEFPHQTRVGQLSLPCTEGCDHRQGTRLRGKVSGFSSVHNSRWLFLAFLQMADNQIPAKFLLPLPRLVRCQSVSQSGKYRAFVTASPRPHQAPSLALPSSCLPREGLRRFTVLGPWWEPKAWKRERIWRVKCYWGFLSLPTEDSQEANTKGQ